MNVGSRFNQSSVSLGLQHTGGQTSSGANESEFEFADRPIESMDRMSDNNFATLSLALSEPQVISSDSAVNVFVLSARPSQASALETVEKSIGTLQSLCALGRP